jgi:hypothetical protein
MKLNISAPNLRALEMCPITYNGNFSKTALAFLIEYK